jgi:hypothetical protein
MEYRMAILILGFTSDHSSPPIFPLAARLFADNRCPKPFRELLNEDNLVVAVEPFHEADESIHWQRWKGGTSATLLVLAVARQDEDFERLSIETPYFRDLQCGVNFEAI